MTEVQDSSQPKVYAVIYTAGQYEDRCTGIVSVYESKEDAEAFVKSMQDWQQHVEDIAIKDKFTPYPCEYTTEDCDYTNLYEEFNSYMWKQQFGDKTEDELTKEDWEKYDNLDNEEFMKKWLVEEKNISEEVAEATIAYNESDEYSDFHKFYYVEEVNYFPKKNNGEATK